MGWLSGLPLSRHCEAKPKQSTLVLLAPAQAGVVATSLFVSSAFGEANRVHKTRVPSPRPDYPCGASFSYPLARRDLRSRRLESLCKFWYNYRQMKRSAIVLICLFASLSACAKEFCDFTYTVLDNRAVRIDVCTNRAAEIVEIPATVEVGGRMLPVEVIGINAFMDCAVTSLTFPHTIKDIGSYAFAECNLLTNITYNGVSSITNIGSFAFYKCEQLPMVKIPASVEVIGDSAFFWCPQLLMILFEGLPPKANPPHLFEREGGCVYYLPKHSNAWKGVLDADGTWDGFPAAEYDYSALLTDFDYHIWHNEVIILKYHGQGGVVKIPASFGVYPVVEIGYGAFADSQTITSVEIPKFVTRIESDAFRWCGSLSRVTIPSAVTTIEPYAFSECANLKKVDFAPDSKLEEISDGIFEGCLSLTEMTIPPCVSRIAYKAFSACTSLTALTIPPAVEYIFGEAFSDCTQLAKIHFEGAPPSVIDEYAFYGVRDDCKGYYLPEYASEWEDRLASKEPWCGLCMTEENSIAPAMDFEYTQSDGKITIKKYRGSSDMVIIPNWIDKCPVVAIGDYAFANCRFLTSVQIPRFVASIGFGAFEWCDSLTSIEIPALVTVIEGESFQGCAKLRSLVFKENSRLVTIKDFAFGSCTSLELITLPDSLEQLGHCAFGKCTSLQFVRLPASVSTLESSAFYACEALQAVSFDGPPPTWTQGSLTSFASNCYGYYSFRFAEAWEMEGVIVDGKWNGISMQPGWVSIPLHGLDDTEQDAIDRAILSIAVGNGVKITDANLNVFLDVTNEGTLIHLSEGRTATVPPYYTVGVSADERVSGFSLALNEKAKPVLGVSSDTGTAGSSPFVINSDGSVELHLSETIADSRLTYYFKGAESLDATQWDTIKYKRNPTGRGIKFNYTPQETDSKRYKFFKVVVSDTP